MARRHFRRPSDYLALAVIVIVTVVTFGLVRNGSDAHNTQSQTADVAVTQPADPDRPPPSLAEAWQAPSAATPQPVTSGGTVVTGDASQVIGRDPFTGKQRWRYARDYPLCTVAPAWSRILAVYRKNGWCGETTALDAGTGKRGPQRNGDVQPGTQLVTDGVYVTATGSTLLTTVRSDLVQTMVYGDQPDANNAGRQPRTGCTYRSVAVDNGRIGVVEHCRADQGMDRFSVYEATNTDADRPKVDYSVKLPAAGARVIAMNGEYAAVVVPSPTPRMLVLSQDDGSITTQYPVQIPAGDLAGLPPGRVVPVTKGAAETYWFTGSSVTALNPATFRPEWTVPGTLGPPALYAGRALVPVPGGLDLLDASTGQRLGHYPVDRKGYTGPVTVSTLGPVVLEQRGNLLVALR